jgi:hypothetical protein
LKSPDRRPCVSPSSRFGASHIHRSSITVEAVIASDLSSYNENLDLLEGNL